MQQESVQARLEKKKNTYIFIFLVALEIFQARKNSIISLQSKSIDNLQFSNEVISMKLLCTLCIK